LIDAHVHLACDVRPKALWDSIRNYGLLLLMHRVLGIRDLGNLISLYRNYMYVNPELTLQYSIIIDKPPYPWYFIRPVLKLEEGVKEVERAFAEGASWIKSYNNVTEDITKAVIARAKELGLKITGHTTTIGFKRAVEIGFDSIEHIMSLVDPIKAKSRKERIKEIIEKWEKIDEGMVEKYVKIMKNHNTSIIPTLALFRSSVKNL